MTPKIAIATLGASRAGRSNLTEEPLVAVNVDPGNRKVAQKITVLPAVKGPH